MSARAVVKYTKICELSTSRESATYSARMGAGAAMGVMGTGVGSEGIVVAAAP